MAAGRLRRRVQFQTRVEVRDEGGGVDVAWSTQLEVWGGLKPARGLERLEAGRLEGSFAGTLRVRSSEDTRAIDTSWRVVIRGVDYQIRAIANPDQRDKYLDMEVERGVAT